MAEIIGVGGSWRKAAEYLGRRGFSTSAARALPVCAFASTPPGRPPYNSAMRRLVLTLFLLLVLAGGYTAYWLVLAHQLEAGLGPWAEAQRAAGLTVAWQSVAVEGFPASFRLRFSAASAAGDRPVRFSAAAPLLVAKARPWNLRQWRLSAPQGAGATLPEEASGCDSAAADGSISLGRGRSTVIDLSLRDLAGNGLAAGLRIAGAEARLELPDRPPASHLDAGITAAVRLSDVTLPKAVPAFGKEVETLSLALTVKGALPPGKLRDALAAWRQDGGTVELTDGSLHWGALTLDASGTLALDDQLQPIGALTATIENQNAIVDAAVASGNLRAADAGLVKIVLGLLAKPGADGKKRLTVPVSLQNERLYLGPAKIAALPRIGWE